MTRGWSGFGGCLALLLFLGGCSQRMDSDTHVAAAKAVQAQDEQWSKTAATNNVDDTVAFYTDDASILPPNAPIATGKQAIRAVWAAMLTPDTTVSWQVTKADAARSGDLAYVMGVYQITPKNEKGKPLEDHGKLVEVWKKQSDGSWKVVADIFNSDIPAPATAGKN